MKPKFEEMSVPDLRAYVLKHKDDLEAIQTLFYHPSLKWKTMPPLVTEDGKPIEENIPIAEEEIKKRTEIGTKKQKEKELQKEQELKARLRQEIEQELEEKIRAKLEKEIEEKLRQQIEREKDQESQS